MDHLIQIPQVDRAWEPIPEPWVTLGLLAGLDTSLRLGTLVSPVTLRPAGVIAKSAATLDVLSGGRAFCGLGAGWWEREHAAYGIDFPPAGTGSTGSRRPSRPCGRSGDRARSRTTGTASTCPRPPATRGRSDRCRSSSAAVANAHAEDRRHAWATAATCGSTTPCRTRSSVFTRYREDAGRPSMITVLDLPLIGHDREDAARRVERVRGRLTAPAYAARHPVGPADVHRRRWADLADSGSSRSSSPCRI